MKSDAAAPKFWPQSSGVPSVEPAEVYTRESPDSKFRIEESEGGSAAVVAADAAARPDNDVEPVADWLAASVSA